MAIQNVLSHVASYPRRSTKTSPHPRRQFSIEFRASIEWSSSTTMEVPLLDPSHRRFKASSSSASKVVANLVRNAIDAIAGLNGRTRVLTASSTVTDGHASIKTADTGAGIDCASTERVFDALYTTKNEGLGLGMSICRDIIAAHGGRLWVDRNTTQGATPLVRLSRNN